MLFDEDRLTLPTIQTFSALQKGKDISEDGRETTENNGQDPESRESLPDFEACVPACDEVGAA